MPCLQRLPLREFLLSGQKNTSNINQTYAACRIRASIRGARLCRRQPSPVKAVSQAAARATAWDPDNPDLDQIDVTSVPKEELGLDEDEETSQYDPDDLDPEGRELKLEDLYSVREGTPESLIYELYSDDIYGPPAVVLAGFRAEEFAMVRAILDSAGGQEVKVIPVSGELLYEKMSTAIYLPEPDWEKARPGGWSRGGDWGSQRVILFSGMKLAAQAALVELLEESGLPPVCAALAVEEDAEKQLGRVLAEAVQAQRARRNPHKNVWEELDRTAKELPDVESFLKRRVQEIQQDVEAGNLDNVIVKKDMGSDGGEMTLAEVQEHLGVNEGAQEATVSSSVTDINLDPEPSPYARRQEAQVLQPGSSSDPVSSQEDALSSSEESLAEELHFQEQSMPRQRNKPSDDRLELRDSVLGDPLTKAHGEAALQTMGSSGGEQAGKPSQQKEALKQQVEEQARSAGKFFMDSLARNAGLAADADMQPSQSLDEASGSLDVIDAIAEGRPVELPESISKSESTWLNESTAAAGKSEAAEVSANREAEPRESEKAAPSQPSLTVVDSLEDGQKAAHKIVADLDKKFKNLRKETDKDKVTDALRKEAWDPTKDAIKAALACGIPAEDLKRLIDEEAAEREKDMEGWATAWTNMPPMMPTEEEKAKAAARTGSDMCDIFSPMPVSRRTGQQSKQPASSQAAEGADPAAQPVSANEGSSAEEGKEFGGQSGSDGGFSSKSGTMTKKELRAFAERRNLDYAQLLAGAEAQGIELPEE